MSSCSALEAPSCSGDSPTPLRSSDLGPVEASLEDLSLMTSGAIQVDAVPDQPSAPPNLQHKLEQELNYHKHGSYVPEQRPNRPSYLNPSPLVQTVPNSNGGADPPQQVSSVHSWSKPQEAYETQLSVPASQCGPHLQSKLLERLPSWSSEYSAAGIPPQTETGTQTHCCRKACLTVYR